MSFFNLFRQTSANSISDSQLAEMMDSPNPPLLIDVRSPQEYRSGHIKNSKNIPVDTLAEELAQGTLDKSTSIVLYCQSGARSSHGCSILSGLGYDSVYDLGGLRNWRYGFVK